MSSDPSVASPTIGAKSGRALPQPTASETHLWFLYDQPTQRPKPVKLEELQDLLEAGGVGPHESVWKVGLPDWAPMHTVPELRALLGIKEIDPNDVEEWYYMDDTQKAQGPLSVNQMISLAEDGVIDVNKFAWRESNKDWKIIRETPELKEVVAKAKPVLPPVQSDFSAATKECPWFYMDNYRVVQGPVDVATIKLLYKSAQVSPNTLFWKEGMQQWSQLEEIEDLASVFETNGAADNTTEDIKKKPLTEEELKKKEEKKKKRKNKQNAWKKNAKHTSIYITGLPSDVTEEELFEHFKKVGAIKDDEEGKPLIKLYKGEHNVAKGDARITFLMEDAVRLAIEVLDGQDFRYKCPIHIEEAKFQPKADFVPKKPKIDQPDFVKKNAPNQYQKKLAWDEDEDGDGDGDGDGGKGQGSSVKKGLRIVILKHMFTLEEAKSDPHFYEDLKREVGLECEKNGSIEKITVFEGNPDGVIAIKFKKPRAAQACIEAMNDRFFSQRQITCEYFDGKTNYKVKESEADADKRLKEFGDWIEGQS